MRAVYEAIKVIVEHYNIKPGDTFTVTVNHAGSPSIAYERKITRNWVDELTGGGTDEFARPALDTRD